MQQKAQDANVQDGERNTSGATDAGQFLEFYYMYSLIYFYRSISKQVFDEKATGVLAKARMLQEGELREEGNTIHAGSA